MGLFNLFKASRRVVVIDGDCLGDSSGSKGKMPPRNQLQMLRRIARFAQREKLDVVVVLSGSPLHKAPDGKKFEEIKVLYSDSPDAHERLVAATARSHGSGSVVVTDNAAIIRQIGKSAGTMRMSTFRKAFDTGGGEMDAPERGGSSRAGRGKPRRRSQKQPEEKKQEFAAPKEMSEADAINELIDLVD